MARVEKRPQIDEDICLEFSIQYCHSSDKVAIIADIAPTESESCEDSSSHKSYYKDEENGPSNSGLPVGMRMSVHKASHHRI